MAFNTGFLIYFFQIVLISYRGKLREKIVKKSCYFFINLYLFLLQVDHVYATYGPGNGTQSMESKVHIVGNEYYNDCYWYGLLLMFHALWKQIFWFYCNAM